jgi:hypothetical protein
MISHIFYKDELGLAATTKYQKNEIPKQGEIVTSFYDEKLEFLNLAYYYKNDNEAYIYFDNKLESINTSNLTGKIFEYSQKFLNYFFNLNNDLFLKIIGHDASYIKHLEYIVKEFALKNETVFKITYTPNNLTDMGNIEKLKESYNYLIVIFSLSCPTTTHYLTLLPEITNAFKSAMSLVWEEYELPLTTTNSNLWMHKEDIPEEPELYIYIQEIKAYQHVTDKKFILSYNLQEQLKKDQELNYKEIKLAFNVKNF